MRTTIEPTGGVYMSPKHVYMVFYRDPEGLLISPMGWDDDCDGAICVDDDNLVAFETRAQAQKAIAISRAWWKLCREQGKPLNDDFCPAMRKHVRIVKVAIELAGLEEATT
jgi:hypothetical protein